jgi:hypothetical protein
MKYLKTYNQINETRTGIRYRISDHNNIDILRKHFLADKIFEEEGYFLYDKAKNLKDVFFYKLDIDYNNFTENTLRYTINIGSIQFMKDLNIYALFEKKNLERLIKKIEKADINFRNYYIEERALMNRTKRLELVLEFEYIEYLDDIIERDPTIYSEYKNPPQEIKDKWEHLSNEYGMFDAEKESLNSDHDELQKLYDGELKPGYYYEHQNGKIIFKPFSVVDSMGPEEYFDSPFCLRWWKVNTLNKDAF